MDAAILALGFGTFITVAVGLQEWYKRKVAAEYEAENEDDDTS